MQPSSNWVHRAINPVAVKGLLDAALVGWPVSRSPAATGCAELRNTVALLSSVTRWLSFVTRWLC